jgi:parallel beta-helix repeat protein
VAFYVQKARASGTIYIRADGSIDPPTAPIATVDNVTYTLTGNITSDADGIVVERDNIVVYGKNYAIQGPAGWPESVGIDLAGRSNVTIQNTNVYDFWVSGISLNSSTNNNIFGNRMKHARICLISSSCNSVSGNYITESEDGIRAESSSNNSISGNNVVDNGVGIEIIYSSNNTVSGNTVGDNIYGNVVLSSSSYNNVSGNKIAKMYRDLAYNNNGIVLRSSCYNSISSNNITDINVGITLASSSNNNAISGNNIRNNNYGISLEGASDNVIYHNNFPSTTNPVWWDRLEEGLVNVWDDGSEGNYWSDYSGVDANNDGIGDTPYIIAANNTDHYPLMTQYVIPEFPSALILPIFFIATLLVVIVHKRKHPQNE